MEQRELELVEGTVSVVIYQNEDNGYTILKLDVRDEEVTVVGTMPGCGPRRIPICPGPLEPATLPMGCSSRPR